jgi:putative ABC transport system permease protein
LAISEHEEGLEAQADIKRKMSSVSGVATAPASKQEDHDHDHDHDHPATTTTTTDASHEEHAEEHGEHGHAEHFSLNPDGTINLGIPKDEWQVSAILVKARSGFAASSILYRFKLIDLRATAVNPAEVMRQFFDNFLKGSTMILLVISLLVIVVAAVGILVAIYNSVSARMREIAILRALGATRNRILALICLEAGLIGLVGAVLGIVAGHAIAAGASVYLNRLLGQGIRWYSLGIFELWCLLGVVAIAALAGLVPALKAYKSPVATNLTTA